MKFGVQFNTQHSNEQCNPYMEIILPLYYVYILQQNIDNKNNTLFTIETQIATKYNSEREQKEQHLLKCNTSTSRSRNTNKPMAL